MSKSVLVVDDEADLLDLMVLELRMSKFEASPAENFNAAVQALSEKPYDFILTDIRMPGRDGMEVLKYCREQFPQTRVILMTGFADIDVETTLSKGAVGRLEKPFSRDQLREIIVRHEATGKDLWCSAVNTAGALHWALRGNAVEEGHIKVGNGGFMVTHNLQEARPGSVVSIALEKFGSDQQPLNLSGVVAWSRALYGKTAYGVAFAGLNQLVARRIEAYLTDHPTIAFIPAGP